MDQLDDGAPAVQHSGDDAICRLDRTSVRHRLRLVALRMWVYRDRARNGATIRAAACVTAGGSNGGGPAGSTARIVKAPCAVYGAPV